MKRLVLGLAGGVAGGKSMVASLFRNWGASVVDADAIGHEVLGRAGIRARLVRAWGPDILRGGRVDRAALALRAFASRESVARLNGIVHPAIRREILGSLRRARGWVVLDAALLFEAGLHRSCDRVVFVRAPRKVRQKRAAARGWPSSELARREKLQWTPAEKIRSSDYVIDNAGLKSRTKIQARRIFEEIRKLF